MSARLLGTGLVVAILAGGSARANPVDAFGLGARIPAMGGAGIAVTDDTTAGYYNPAVLGFFEHLRFDLAYQYSNPKLTINDNDLGVDSSRGVASGLAVPGRIGPLKASFGATFFLPDRYYTRNRSLEGQQPRFQLFDNRPQRFLMSFNAGVSWGDRVAIGGGVSYLSATKGSVILRGRIGFPDASDSDLVQGLDIDVVTVVYPQAGILVRAADWLDIGLTYRAQYEQDIELTLDIQGDIGSQGEEPVVEDGFFNVESVSRDFFQPAQFSAGFSARPTADLLLAFELAFHRWSEFANPATKIAIELDAGQFNDEIDIDEMPPPPPDPKFDDIWVPRIGVEWRALSNHNVDGFVRGGYYFEPSPAPEQTGESNFVDNDKHAFSLGAGVLLRDVTELLPLPFSIDAYLSMMAMPERLHRKESPTDPIGDYRSRGFIYSAGLGTSWRF